VAEEHIQVLLVEDDERFAQEFVARLRNSPAALFDVEWVATRQRGCALLASRGKRHFDLIVADYNLSRTDGGTGVDVLSFARAEGHAAFRALTTASPTLPAHPGPAVWDETWLKEHLLRQIEAWARARQQTCDAIVGPCPFKRRSPTLTCHLALPQDDPHYRHGAIGHILTELGIGVVNAARDDWSLASVSVSIVEVGDGTSAAQWVEIGRAVALHRKLVVLREHNVKLPRHVDAQEIEYPETPPYDEHKWLGFQLRNALKNAGLPLPRPSRQTAIPPLPPDESASRRLPQPGPAHKVHFFSATPMTGVPLDTSEEYRAVELSVRGTRYRDHLELRWRGAARVADVIADLTAFAPDVVHFSGHCSSQQGLIFVGHDRGEDPVDVATIEAIFRGRPHVRLVLINACESLCLADALLQHVDAAILMTQPISDRAAIAFSTTFYQSLGNGATLERAFGDGRASLIASSPDEADVPRLITRSDHVLRTRVVNDVAALA
jgi:CheY-like chemotaxis protein